MDFIDVYGINHENCTLITPTREYSRINIFMDSVGRRFVAMSPDPVPSKYGSVNSHWKRGRPSEAPKDYFYIDLELSN
ncbi:hypothetical protein EFS17_06720 [Levilactobacillus brevis]|nr:hypothetical protein [Levilactobacillus brevis]MCT3583644.1 hypothetical protein [Levilactobacillus brevis]